MPRKIVTVVGARPQFVKAAAISRVIRDDHAGALQEVLLHTGQHYDRNMSQVFFDELDVPHPKYNLEISGGHHGAMTGRMLEAIETVLIAEKPDWVLIYGDTNSTLAGALAAVKLHIPVAHVEAGLRSFNRIMPEEVNRIVADRVASLLFCPTNSAVANLAMEGIVDGVTNVGDVMYDVALFYRGRSAGREAILESFNLTPGAFALATCHRAENTDDPLRLRAICLGLADIATQMDVVLPLHPRTRRLLSENGMIPLLGRVQLVDPLSFLGMLALEQAARVVVTDSGGVQKEAYFYGVPCVTMRDETEWVETIELKWNRLVGASRDLIASAALSAGPGMPGTSPYGDGHAAQRIVDTLLS
ncbi:MAG: UDP-N-acetylglucosamine 2-epimerase (non-hydrolyzing) [Sulfuritalea sp.]|nr:UDP-N-acetylglucosamine 2-epimerase (non-hydrolyzing) [Sulfuritalea sp.]